MIPTNNSNKIKKDHNIPLRLASCHTGISQGYFLEGHIPAEDIKKLLREKPEIRGLAVPGMPGGSPGMESSPYQSYEVLSVGLDDTIKVFSRH